METLIEYRRLSHLIFGEDSGATKFLDDKIAEQGADKKVTQHENKMLMLLTKLDREQPRTAHNKESLQSGKAATENTGQ
jgi:hypothetical protein